MRKTNNIIGIFVVTLIIGIIALPAASYAAGPTAQPKATQPSVPTPLVGEPAKFAPVIKDIQPMVMIINPAEGETWYGTETHDIQWKTVAIPEGFKIKITFVRSDKSEFSLADNLPRSGNFSWNIQGGAFQWKQVPAMLGGSLPVPVDATGKLKLIASDGGKTYEGEVSISLVVPKIKITSPQNGDTWYTGKTYPVTWKNIGPAISPVQINIESGSGISANFLYWTNMANTGSTGSQSITVPTSPILDNTTNCSLNVVSSLMSFPGPYYYDKVSIKVMK